jgi:hypothetical protein
MLLVGKITFTTNVAACSFLENGGATHVNACTFHQWVKRVVWSRILDTSQLLHGLCKSKSIHIHQRPRTWLAQSTFTNSSTGHRYTPNYVWKETNTIQAQNHSDGWAKHQAHTGCHINMRTCAQQCRPITVLCFAQALVADLFFFFFAKHKTKCGDRSALLCTCLYVYETPCSVVASQAFRTHSSLDSCMCALV